MAKRKSRKRRGPRAEPPRSAEAEAVADETLKGYARSRAKDEAARAALKPLRPGERPGAVTVGAIVAALFAVANIVALAFGYNAGEDTLSPGSEATGSIVAALILALVAYGMWRARYWGVLGMQTLLALTLIFSSLALIGVNSLWAGAAAAHHRLGGHAVLVPGQGDGAHPDARAAER